MAVTTAEDLIAAYPKGDRPLAARTGGGIRTLFAALTIVLVVYAGSLVVRGPDGVSPTWLDG